MNPKKTLLPRTQSSQAIETNQESMVEQAPFDIYLCDNCEAELYSLEAYQVIKNKIKHTIVIGHSKH